MSVKERDPLTGHMTTGHEWNGITELNTRVPPPIWWFIGITHVWALVIWILLPTWPLVTTYTKGLLGLDQREEVEEKVVAANVARSDWADRIADLPVDEIRADPVLMSRVNDTAHALFGDNCAGCHGADAAGGPGFPSLVDSAWLWGGDADAIMETLRVGINSQHPDTHFGQMLAFGRDGMLSRDEIRAVAAYVQTLSDAGDVAAEGAAADDEATDAPDGAQLFADNCSSCHGEDGGGDTTLGAPDLTDDFWIYGGDEETLFQTVWGGRQGWMPTWEDRLSEVERKILATYILELGGKDAP
ncbi:cytochrome-c oxidase, cbb3-type subunit III [Pikeienuella piscinae]|uniref:Cbb3-type cytochrome c oxidase subunit n=1 Tax=Pikeienuella piscinae TaxID=2748098 RepID=A0A7L5BVY2_9RHOB|nr:cytochrome-c oxidase, cbb3-type subunit III [Pikeienuella piscinae]QIE56025.1 cytochrome-c oxidase, cbb3-type subunit III [Pikeienuella piscinae]